jgi:hypothetical protein
MDLNPLFSGTTPFTAGAKARITTLTEKGKNFHGGSSQKTPLMDKL